MRVECDRCRRVGPAELSVVCPDPAEPGRYAVTHVCSACGAESRFQVTTAASAGPTGTGGRECPKCWTRPVTGAACERCGLAVEHMDGYVADPDVPEVLAAAWAACRAAWDDPAPHDRVAELALSQEHCPWLARRYRTVLRERPDDAVASHRGQRLVRMAEAAMRATATPPVGTTTNRGGRWAIMLVVVLLLAGATVYAVRLMGGRRAVPTAGPRLHVPSAPPPRPAAPPRAPVEAPPRAR